MRTDGTVACWGFGQGHTEPPAGEFVSIDAREFSACGVKRDGSIQYLFPGVTGKRTFPAIKNNDFAWYCVAL